ncbi:TetR family transcriptional regulator [Kineothrix alysoides]|uniref:TetR family transcriptional regulator n=1 Tax=Kineothrix alysoides TaxID=1469948 RepID=A0A4R1R4Q2_9FIRM|nr:TetR/AcrR family transcriptional regulator [Kineothrix alysoides]TCL60463.1 TetR family transcriptional regulator [Kineothrix alysoides]
MKETKNPIALQSKNWIITSLLELMKKYKYSEITIKDITKKADLDRRTFYRHFQSKDDVICACIKTICDEYIGTLQSEKSPSAYTTAKIYFTICLKHLDFLILMNKHGLSGFLFTKYNEYMPRLQDNDVSPELKLNYGDHITYLYAFNNGGFWALTLKWLENGAIQSPDEMAEVICKILHGMLNCNLTA